MSEEVEEGEQDGKGLLQAEEAVERPFAVELFDGAEVGWDAGEAVGGHDVLAGIVAGCRAVPKEEVVEKCYVGGLVSDAIGGGWALIVIDCPYPAGE